MSKCPTCQIELLDESEICPLCRSIVEPMGELENMYPNARVRHRRLALAVRIYLLSAILLQAALFTIDLLTGERIWWSIITGLVLLYGYLVLRYAIQGTSGHRSKVIVLSALAISLAVAIDFASGYRGWSVDYVLPGGIVAVDVALVICMICNRRGWQSYLMWQLLMILCSLIPAVLFLLHLENNPYFAFLPLALSAAIFLGTMILGDRRARTELYRRFHF